MKESFFSMRFELKLLQKWISSDYWRDTGVSIDNSNFHRQWRVFCGVWEVKLLSNDSSPGSWLCGSFVGDAKINYTCRGYFNSETFCLGNFRMYLKRWAFNRRNVNGSEGKKLLVMSTFKQGVSWGFWEMKLLTNDGSQGSRRCGSLIDDAKICFNRKRAVNISVVKLSAWATTILLNVFEAMNFFLGVV